VQFTAFTAVLRDARGITKRDPDTGRLDPEVKHGHLGSWLGALGYMVLLDQIGRCFKPKRDAPEQGPPMVKALKHFSGLTDEKTCAIFALRCAFAHDYGLWIGTRTQNFNIILL
jgi:hypothetical protein